jgi:L-ribulose-5-phosphate 3-epimerase
MPHPTATRRSMLLAAAAAPFVLGRRLAADEPTPPAPKAPRFEISLAQWSLHRRIRAGELDPLDFAAAAANDHGIRAVEYVNQFYVGKSRDDRYLKKWRKAADDNGVKSLLIMCDGLGALGDPDPKQRVLAIGNHRPWVDAAVALGCHAIRVNALGVGDSDDVKSRVAESLHALAVYSAGHSIAVLVENHGGYSSDGEWVADLVKRADHPGVGTLPDFGNFTRQDGTVADRYVGVAAMMPHAKAVSAKAHDFDADGNEVNTDYAKMMAIVLAAGYRGHVGIEYEGKQDSEAAGIAKTKALLERFLEDDE